ncbi:LysR family transcriptional regulator [Marinomonas rhizomae]|uniref:DNA-binding transcriptional LysR family regulator n=1 Tax=Marinomonas rhizomae TaxID=491948 RepID=A0A366JC99_9GAMM|nr:LysR family transcriptional regulator [Marinomonas rhizomae]RBP83934.1 DNA-binding transcriptional LysR family regulator [Marinomonas rhizomae]RNF73363.1 LysR family transcriptional regulator [Marinomonas rhizomae]
MKLDQLRAFIAVVETGSFRSAADSIHKTQPGISAAVKALEEQYGILLFDRNSYRPTLTTEGHAFFQQSKKLMSQVLQLENLGHDLAQGTEAPLQLCLSQMALDDDCMSRIKAFQQRHTGIALDITTDHLYGVQDKLTKNKCEIAIGPRYGLDDRHAFIELNKITMIAVINPELLVTLNAGDTKIKQQSLYSIPQILVNDTTANASENGHRYVLPTGKRWYVNDFQAKKTLLIHGLGWARMPRHCIQSELKNGQLVPIEVENFTSQNQLPIFMIRLRHQTMSSQANIFWEMMKNFSNNTKNDL